MLTGKDLKFWRSELKAALERELEYVNGSATDEAVASGSLHFADTIRGLAFLAEGVLCEECGGAGRKAYANTATWHGGGGAAGVPGEAQAFTNYRGQ